MQDLLQGLRGDVAVSLGDTPDESVDGKQSEMFSAEDYHVRRNLACTLHSRIETSAWHSEI